MNQPNLPPWSTFCGAIFVLAWIFTGINAADAQVPADEPAQGVESLTPFRDFVGEWRGVGQPQRGSTRGAWVERGQWQWKFTDGKSALVFQSPQGKLIHAAELRPARDSGLFELTVEPAPGDNKSEDAPTKTIYQGKTDADGRLVVTTSNPPAELPARITIGLVANGDRLLMLLERKAPAGERYSRLAEVGYTREGSQFGKGNTQPECVVTGGHGSIAVEFEGKTYYVCCSGCRDLFNDDPAGTLAEYRKRKEEEQAKQQQ